ncbi:hypothetical protein AbraIFM66950_011057 [Aspergillus brasiliensis]|nr:hypothetical protein AbraIFM66950_011057 [Aspergillus brasiliensis]
MRFGVSNKLWSFSTYGIRGKRKDKPEEVMGRAMMPRGAVAIDFGATQESLGDAGNSPSTTTVASMAAGLRNE